MDHGALLEQLPDAVIAADRAGVIRVWNAAAESLFGHRAKEAIGQSLDIVIPERLRPAHWKAYDEALEAGRTKHGHKVLTTRAVHASGEKLYVAMSFAVVLGPDGDAVGAVAVARMTQPPQPTQAPPPQQRSQAPQPTPRSG